LCGAIADNASTSPASFPTGTIGSSSGHETPVADMNIDLTFKNVFPVKDEHCSA
jgi:hypothetical protein